ncbi:MAG: sigma-54-dependent transcriptional regulator [Bacteroidales bacterium]
MTNGTILIVDREKESLRTMEQVLRSEFEKVITLQAPDRIPEVLRRNEVDVVILDTNFKSAVHNGNEGLFWMREVFNYDSNISVVIVTASDDSELAVRAIREGAMDFVLKPWENAKLRATVNAAWQLRQSKLEASSLKKDNLQLKEVINSGSEKIIRGASPTMIRVMDTVKKVAATDANVLITGENGTGKELVAKEIHRLSGRSGELMVSVDMGSLTESLFESELFGHVRGAFTDAREERTGKFEAADNSTLFLDEIGNLSLQAQAKILRVLQNRSVCRVGSNRQKKINIRLITATNCDIMKMVKEGRFREDLLYRINTIMIEVPPLRDRVDDIPVLANHFLRDYSSRYGRGEMKISIQTLEKLSTYDWPGNVRELQHAIEKAVILSDSPVLKPSDFIFSQTPARSSHGEMTLEEMERRLIADSLKRHSGNISIAAAKLGITRQTLYNKMKVYGF